MDTSLKNLPPFYIGQEVEYVTGVNMPKHSKHTVTEIIRRDCCNSWGIGINGIPVEKIPANGRTVVCSGCGVDTNRSFATGKNCWRATSFRPIQRYPLMTFEKIKESSPEILIPN